MSFAETLILGTISGLTIFLGLPLARIRALSTKHMAFLNALAIGVLLFLFVDIVHHAIAPIEEAVTTSSSDTPALFAVLVAGFLAGLLGLVLYAQRNITKGLLPERLAMLVATGLGLHNFSEGLAIGASASKGEIALALTLIIGFGLHNLTEAFGIAAPLVGQRTGWGTLGLAGLVAGGPNFLGTAIGFSFTSDVLSVLFLALAAGAPVFVIGELYANGRRLAAPAWSGWGMGVGFVLAFATELVLVAVGA